MKPLVAVSRCLLGERVRYDGRDKMEPDLIRRLARFLSLVAVCPEVEAGLTIPRPPVELVQDANGKVSALGREDPTLDVTPQLIQFSDHFCRLYPILSGAVLQSRSPSCGVGDAPLLLQSGEDGGYRDGLFTERLRGAFPAIPIVSPRQLESPEAIERFVAAARGVVEP